MKFLFLIFLLPLKLLAQDITGVWTGALYNDTTKQYLKYELAISEYNGKLSGYSHTIFLIDSVENIGVKSIKIKKSGDDYLVEDDKLIYNNYTAPPAKGVKTYSELVLSQNDTSMILSGPWKTNTTKVYKSITGNILLKKKRKIEETLIIPKLENLGVAKSLSFMAYNNYSKDVAIANTPVNNLQITNTKNQDTKKNNQTANSTSLNSPDKKEIESRIKQSPADNAASTEKPVNNSPLNKKPDQNIIQKNPTAINASLNFSENKEIENNVKQASTDTQHAATTNQSVLNQQPNKIPEKDIAKNNASAHGKAINPTENKDVQGKAKQASESNTSNITNASTQKNWHDDTIVSGDSGLHNKTDTTVSINEVDVTKKESRKSINKNASEPVQKSSTTAKPGIAKNDVSKVSSINTEVDKTELKEKKEQINPVKLLAGNNEMINANINPISKAAADISSRQIEAVQSVEIKNDSLLLTLYDNGEIDGDTVSVLLNGKVIMPMQGLTANGISKTIYLTPEMGDSIVLIMYAENLGSIPPNTGLLIVHDGEARHEIRFTGDLQKNSAIILRRKKKI
jgi:hypothetical protein